MEGCTYGTPSKIHLANHIRVHTGEEPYECDHSECQYRAKSNSALRYHKIKNHGYVPRPYNTKKSEKASKESET
ncbi:hypothetical protein BJ165DRAFT_1446748 [Panaeolus papilionaceus]|nr:hypothetical protein BJ165DRAFT_1446748 [Panaeolus papilionaceus]